MNVAAGLLGGGGHHRAKSGIGAFQRGEAEFGRRVGVLHRKDQLEGFICVGLMQGVVPFRQQARQAGLLDVEFRRFRQWPAAAAEQVVDQNKAVSLGDGQDLVDTISVERGEGGFRGVVGLQVVALFLVLMAHDQRAALADRGQGDDQRGEHARLLFRVAVRDEEAALIVDQQLIQAGVDRIADAKALGDAGDDGFQCLRPLLAGKLKFRRADLPGTADAGVDDCFAAAAIRRLLGDRDQLLGLGGNEWQGDWADALNRQTWGEHLLCAADAERCRPVDCF